MRPSLLCWCLAFFCSCELPAVFAGADQRQNTEYGRIAGQVIVSTAARGNIILFLYDASRPPPPYGSGRPLSFTLISRQDVFGDALDNDSGPFTAPYAFSLVPPGHYFVAGFIDVDDDFIPWYGVTAGATEGDVPGAALNPATRAFRKISVDVDDNGQPQAALDIPVSFSETSRLAFDRPTFSIASDAKISLSTQPQRIELAISPIDDGLIHSPKATFLTRLVDDDGDGVADDRNGDGLPDVWPRIVVRKMEDGDNLLLDENDVNQDGLIDDTGTDYAHDPDGLDGIPDAVVIAASIDVSAQQALLLDAQDHPKSTPTPLSSLSLILWPRAFDVSSSASPKPLRVVPRGRYAITIVQQTGQVWRVPNELGIVVPGLPQIASQSFFLQID